MILNQPAHLRRSSRKGCWASRGVLVTLLATLMAIGGLAPASQAAARSPSNANLVFKVPSTISSASLASATIPGIVSWTQGKSASSGISCCTNRVYDDASSNLIATTNANHLKVVLYHDGPDEELRIDSFDATGTYVGTAYAYYQADAEIELAELGDDSWASYSQGNWATRTDVKSLSGSVEYSTSSGSTATFTCYCRDFAWITTTGPTHGQAAIYVNGEYVATVSTHSANTQRRRVVFQQSWPIGGSADQAIEIVNLGTPGHSEVDVDGGAFIWED